MSQQIPTGKIKQYFTTLMQRLCAPSSLLEMQGMSDLDLRDLGIGRSQIPYLFQAPAVVMPEK